MQQTADVEILWITVDVAAECLPAYGSFFSSAAVVDGDAMATDVDVEMTAACGSSFFLLFRIPYHCITPLSSLQGRKVLTSTKTRREIPPRLCACCIYLLADVDVMPVGRRLASSLLCSIPAAASKVIRHPTPSGKIYDSPQNCYLLGQKPFFVHSK